MDTVCEVCSVESVGLVCSDACWREHGIRNNPRAMARRERRAAKSVAPFYVVSYRIHNQYGGPEEGGWWYDAVEIVDVGKCWTAKAGLAAVRALREDNPQPRYGRTSSLGTYDAVVTTAACEAEFPVEDTERPVYS